jgi:hypothetical protein
MTQHNPGEASEGVSQTYPAVSFLFLSQFSERYLRRVVKDWEFLCLGYIAC